MCHANILVRGKDVVPVFERHGNTEKQVAYSFNKGNDPEGFEKGHGR